MQERNVLSGATSAFLAPLIDGWGNLILWIGFALLLILMDLRFGWAAAKKRGEKPRKSRALRRTINKLVDYICWISLAWFIGHTFGSSFNVPILAVIVLAIIYIIEFVSIADNYLEYKGINKKLNWQGLFSKLFQKHNIDIFVDKDEDKE